MIRFRTWIDRGLEHRLFAVAILLVLCVLLVLVAFHGHPEEFEDSGALLCAAVSLLAGVRLSLLSSIRSRGLRPGAVTRHEAPERAPPSARASRPPPFNFTAGISPLLR